MLSYASGEATPLSKGRGGFDSLRERQYIGEVSPERLWQGLQNLFRWVQLPSSPPKLCGYSTAVVRHVANVKVVGSIPTTRSSSDSSTE